MAKQPDSMEELLNMGTVKCPYCKAEVKTTEEELLAHMKQHSEVLRKLQVEEVLNGAVKGGLMQRTPA